MTFTATYSPDDNKLRLYASSRLDPETYARVKAAGFKWAPRQELFVAPMWTPEREDLLLELAGEIDDEDESLIDRAEERSERFDDYSDKRRADAEAAKSAVDVIADGIPLGQPILVGHHSERHARRDAERIQSGMRKAVRMWETSNYWSARARGAFRHAKYKELPAVRHRRIKTLEAEKRKCERNLTSAKAWQARWNTEGMTDEQVIAFANASYDYDNFTKLRDGTISSAELVALKLGGYANSIARIERWIAHYDNRLVYERAMLNEQLGADASTEGGMAARFDLKAGGKVMVRDGWLVILRVNKVGGVVESVTTTAPPGVTWTHQWKYGVEQIRDYQPPTDDMAARVKKANALPPLCNYPGEGFREMTEAEWNGRKKWSDFPYIGTVAATAAHGRHRVRQMPTAGSFWKKQQIYITDVKLVDPPAPEPTPAPDLKSEPVPMVGYVRPQPREDNADEVEFRAMRESLKGGVRTIAAPQLFPTPSELAARVVALADIRPGHSVLEPSAGSGKLIDAMIKGKVNAKQITAVEISAPMTDRLRGITYTWLDGGSISEVRCADFLECNGDLGTFDRVVMNPPFSNGADIKHIEHALSMLKPGGRLVAICANGPRQREQLMPRATEWHDLPDGSFHGQGTDVRAAILVIDN